MYMYSTRMYKYEQCNVMLSGLQYNFTFYTLILLMHVLLYTVQYTSSV